MIFQRKYYLDKLISKKGSDRIKIVTGIRRCGKSFLLFRLFKEYLLKEGVDIDHIIEIAFDSFANKKYRDPEILYPYIEGLIKDKKEYYILFDEIQLLGEFEAVLNGLIRMQGVDVYVTGSNARFLSKDIITEFRGRGDEIHIGPLSFAEFMTAYQGNPYDGWKEYVLYGGLPPVVLLPTAEEKVSYLKTVFEETYISDIIGRHHVRNTAELEELLDILSSAVGSLTNPRKLCATFKSVKNIVISPKTIQKYLEYFEDSFLITSAKRYDVKGKKYIGSPLKYYFSDMGLRNARINFRQVEEPHLMENIIFNELLHRGYNVDIGIVTIQYRNHEQKMTRKQLEVDFICNKGDKRYYIQSAFALPTGEKKMQEQRPLTYIDDSFKKIIITKDAVATLYNDEGILNMSIFDFLLDPKSLEI